MQSNGPAHTRSKASCIASRIQLFERLSKSATQSARSAKQRLVSTCAAGLDAESTSKPTTLHFKTHFQCAYGEQLKLVGNTAELGNWDVSSAPALNWTSGDAWTGQVALQSPDTAKFKLVHLSHGGVIWEPVSDRKLQMQAEGDVKVDMAWGSEGFQVVSQQPQSGDVTDQSPAAVEFEQLWNPSQTSIPQTLPSAFGKARHRQSPFDVTLEPEWGVLDLEEPEPSAGEESATDDYCTPSALNGNPGLAMAAPVNSAEIHQADALPPAEQYRENPTQPASLLDHSAEPLVAESGGKGLIKKRKKNRRTSHPWHVSQVAQQQTLTVEKVLHTARNVVVGTIATATMSTLGAQGQDLLLGSFGLAAGAAVLPKLFSPQKRTDLSETRESIVSIVLGIGETTLKAASLFSAARHSLEQKVQEIIRPRRQEVHDFEHVEVPDLSLLEDELAEYVAKLAQEAAEYAINYRPSQEELFEAAAACSMMEKDLERPQEYVVGNIVSTNVKSLEAVAC